MIAQLEAMLAICKRLPADLQPYGGLAGVPCSLQFNEANFTRVMAAMSLDVKDVSAIRHDTYIEAAVMVDGVKVFCHVKRPAGVASLAAKRDALAELDRLGAL